MLVTVEAFNVYSGNMETSSEVVTMKTAILESAQSVVSDYIGYDLESTEYDEFFSAIGQNKLYLHAQPITEVSSVLLSGDEVPADDYTIGDRYLRLTDSTWPTGVDNVEVVYTAGYTSDTLPSLIAMTIYQIASLMLQETEGNIGITGKSFSENSRTYINYTNFDKWLKKLDPYKILRFV